MPTTPSNWLQKLWYQYSALSLSYLAGCLAINRLASILQILVVNGGHIRIRLLETLLWKEIASTDAHQAMSTIQSALHAIEGWEIFAYAIGLVTSAYWGATLILAHTRRKSGLEVASPWPLKPRFSFFIFLLSIAIPGKIIDNKVHVLTADNAIAANFLHTVFSLGHKQGRQPTHGDSVVSMAVFMVVFAVVYFALAWVIGKLGRRIGFT